MIRTLGMLGLIGCVACGGSVPSETGSAEIVVNMGDASLQPSCPAPKPGMGTFSASSTGLTEWEGRTVHVIAVIQGFPEGTLDRVVDVTTHVKNGAFAVECLGSIPENLNYPAWAVLIDGNGDGTCNSQDVGTIVQNYGWGESAGGELTADQFVPISGLLAPPIGAPKGATFCSVFTR